MNDTLQINHNLMDFISDHNELIKSNSHSLPAIIHEFLSKNENIMVRNI
jgi:hypothetical protein